MHARRLVLTLRLLCVGLVVVACLRVAWVSDDALITLRTALNITHGWGPGFNATESVQAYTHPLWFLIWVGMGATTNQWILGILFASLVFTGVAVGLIVWQTSSIARLVLITGLLILSNAFVEYSTSGLENPLAYLTVGLLMAITYGALGRVPLVRPGRRSYAVAGLTGLVTAAVLLTRLDLAVLIAPVIVLALIEGRRYPRLLGAAAVATLLPLASWFAWSQLTYSTLLPNTFLAKRNLNIPASELIVQGLRYLYVSFEHDPVTMIALGLGIIGAFALGSRLSRVWALGATLYIGYIVWVGGDFMVGRFLAVPVYVSCFLIATLPSRNHPQTATSDGSDRDYELTSVAMAAAVVVVLVVGSAYAGAVPTALANPQDARYVVDQNFNAGVSDERGIYVANGRSLKSLLDNLSLAFLTPNVVPAGDGSGLNRSLRDLNKEAQEWPSTSTYIGLPSEVAAFCGFLGTIGIATGPTVHLVDGCALTDRFLAEQPYTPAEPFAWKPGHFQRVIPDGYVDAIRANNPRLVKDTRESFYLKELWAKIRPPAAQTAPNT